MLPNDIQHFDELNGTKTKQQTPNNKLQTENGKQKTELRMFAA